MQHKKDHFEFSTILFGNMGKFNSYSQFITTVIKSVFSVYSRNLGKIIEFTQSKKC